MTYTYETQLSSIDTQLKRNLDLIDAADVVFVCGRSNSFLTTISLKVGKLQCNKKARNSKRQTGLVVLNRELSSAGFVELLEKIKVAGIGQITRMYPGATFSDLLIALDKGNAVTVHDHALISSYDNVLLEMANKSLSGMVIVHRFMTTAKDMEPGVLMRNFKRNIWGLSLNVLFIESVRDKETGQINLSFSNKTR